MTRVLDALKCGECGGDTFQLASEDEKGAVRFGGGPRFTGVLIVSCVKCGAKSRISAEPPALEVDSEGTLCGGWSGR